MKYLTQGFAVKCVCKIPFIRTRRVRSQLSMNQAIEENLQSYDSDLGPLGEKCERHLCAMQHFQIPPLNKPNVKYYPVTADCLTPQILISKKLISKPTRGQQNFFQSKFSARSRNLVFALNGQLGECKKLAKIATI